MTFKQNRYLLSGGVDPLALCQKYGCPLYVYDTAIIERQYNRFTQAFAVKSLKINYACKALTNVSILQFMRQLGTGLDTVSIQEVELGLHAGDQPAA